MDVMEGIAEIFPTHLELGELWIRIAVEIRAFSPRVSHGDPVLVGSYNDVGVILRNLDSMFLAMNCYFFDEIILLEKSWVLLLATTGR